MSDKKVEILKVDIGTKYQSNSKTSKVEPKKLNKIVNGRVSKQKKPLTKKFLETFVTDDIKNVKSNIIEGILIPVAKDTVLDIFQGLMDAGRSAIEIALLGEVNPRRSSRNRYRDGKSHVSYDKCSYDRDSRISTSRSRTRHDFDDIVFDSRGEAEEVRDCLVDLIAQYNEVTVDSLYELVGITGDYTDRDWGWKNLSSSSISRVRDGYVLNLPRPIYLDKD